MKIAHLSDPHFSKVTFDPRQFLSKRWMGNFNFMLCRQRSYQTAHLASLPDLLSTLNVDAVCITGDFSTTSLKEEFSEGQKFVASFKDKGLPTFTLPGNHDCYTGESQKQKQFYSFFSTDELRDRKVESHSLGNGWWYVGLDCALATPLFCAYGQFYEQTEKNLKEALSAIPPSEHVILCNHFPLFPTGRPRHDLKRADALQSVLKSFPQVKLYLHGHDHTYYIKDQQDEGLPLVLNSGSCGLKLKGAFFLIDIVDNACHVQRWSFNNSWAIEWERDYELRI